MIRLPMLQAEAALQAALGSQMEEMLTQEQSVCEQLVACHHRLTADFQVRLPLGNRHASQHCQSLPCVQSPLQCTHMP